VRSTAGKAARHCLADGGALQCYAIRAMHKKGALAQNLVWLNKSSEQGQQVWLVA
jgi:hypothetical protein